MNDIFVYYIKSLFRESYTNYHNPVLDSGRSYYGGNSRTFKKNKRKELKKRNRK